MSLGPKRFKFLCNRSHRDSDDKEFPKEVDYFFSRPKTNIVVDTSVGQSA